MRVLERIGEFEQPLRSLTWGGQTAREALAEIAARHEIHREIRLVLGGAHRVHRDNVRMTKPRGRVAFANQPLGQPAIRAGHDELRSEIRKQTANSPTMTAGDVDAKWQDAYALGDEAPGGDNMTPDQDRVDDIGKALGIEYADDEELLGGEEITERDEHRWELDPASKDEDEDL